MRGTFNNFSSTADQYKKNIFNPDITPMKEEDRKSNRTDEQLPIIGAKERVYLPDIRKSALLARVDTGARTSSLHCYSVTIEKINRKEVLCVRFMRNSRKVIRFSKFSKKKVKSSNGQVQQRYVVRLKMLYGQQSRLTTFTLNNRSDMRHAVLLGRKFLRNRFLVDVSQSFTLDAPQN